MFKPFIYKVQSARFMDVNIMDTLRGMQAMPGTTVARTHFSFFYEYVRKVS